MYEEPAKLLAIHNDQLVEWRETFLSPEMRRLLKFVAVVVRIVACRAGKLSACDPDLQGPSGFCVFYGDDYISYEPPRPWPVKVSVGLYMEKVFQVNLDEGTVTFQIFLVSEWNDTRVAVILPTRGNGDTYGEFERIPVSSEFARKGAQSHIQKYFFTHK